MQTKTTNYTVRRYSDNQAVGSVDLTVDQFQHYQEMSQSPEGIIRLGALPHDYYNLESEYQDLGPDVTVYLD